MQVQIRCHGIEVSEELNEQFLRRIHFALGRFAANVRSVGVHLTDRNGPRGGPDDKECRVLVQTRSGARVVIQELDVNMHAAVARAAERAGRAVARQLSLLQIRNGNGYPRRTESGD